EQTPNQIQHHLVDFAVNGHAALFSCKHDTHHTPGRRDERPGARLHREGGPPGGQRGADRARSAFAYTHHERIDPAFQRRGIGGAIPRWLQQSWLADGVKTDGNYAYIDAKNAASLAFAGRHGGPGPWPGAVPRFTPLRNTWRDRPWPCG
ncbi:MAG: GNAT family N-acetyltransferase, partial [Dehalococcoidia bacterium]